MVKISDLVHCEYTGYMDYPYWFLNLKSDEVEHLDNILNILDVSKDHFLSYSYDYEYIALPYIDLREIFEAYLILLNNRQIINHYKYLSEDEFVSEYRLFFHIGTEHERWIDYYESCKRDIVIKWCKDNKIHYINDIDMD